MPPEDKWDPFQEFLKLKNVFNEVFERSFRQRRLGEDLDPDHWTPPVDIFYDRNQMVIQVEIPGIDRQKVDIEYQGSEMIIRGERLPRYENGQAEYYRIERQHGPFRRVIVLPEKVDVKNIQARYDAGILTVSLPIRCGSSSRRIPIKVKD